MEPSKHINLLMNTGLYLLGINSPEDKNDIMHVLTNITEIVKYLKEIGATKIDAIVKHRKLYESEINKTIPTDIERIWAHLIAIKENLIAMDEFSEMHNDFLYATHGVLLIDLIKKNKELRKHEKNN